MFPVTSRKKVTVGNVQQIQAEPNILAIISVNMNVIIAIFGVPFRIVVGHYSSGLTNFAVFNKKFFTKML